MKLKLQRGPKPKDGAAATEIQAIWDNLERLQKILDDLEKRLKALEG